MTTTPRAAPPSTATTPAPKKTDFFIGYGRKLPTSLHVFLPVTALVLVGVFAASALLLGTFQESPGEARLRWDLGPQTVVGVLELHPAPVIHARPTATFPNGHSIMLTGQGKVGVQPAAATLDGKLVEVSGFIARRGALDVLVVDTMKAVADDSGSPQRPPVTDLGRWRLTGEICDGKCVAGAMRPGRGVSHKACANLCIIGGAPPVFVADRAAGGSEFFLIADPRGQPVAERLLDLTAVPVEVEGRIERRGDLPVLLLDPDRTRRF
jgi:hypothetical protein